MKIAVYQLTSVLDYKLNLEKINSAAASVKKNGADYLFLPECFFSMSNGKELTPFLVEKEGEYFNAISEIAKNNAIFLLAGTVAFNDDGVIKNRCLNFSPDGSLIGIYDKAHLFACNFTLDSGKKIKINESDMYTPGLHPKVLELENCCIGLGVCFDIRFSTMAHYYHKENVDILTYSSAFTVPTGKAHWHILNRARAIEGQCFVVSPAQWGKHNENIQTFGHSLIVDPWGNILADAGDGEKIIYATLDFNKIKEAREKIIL